MKNHKSLEPTIPALGLDFLANVTPKTIEEMVTGGGVVVIPSAPGLATINHDLIYFNSLKNADYRLLDSGLLTLLLKLRGDNAKKYSGLKLLRSIFQYHNEKSFFFVNPNFEADKKNHLYLKSQVVSHDGIASYVAPIYKKCFHDKDLLKKIEDLAWSPDIIIINLGSNVQEPLADYLSENLSFRPLIVCSGGAIDFLTGRQVKIPIWVDALYLGWLARILSNPVEYGKRYFLALGLIFIFCCHSFKSR